MTKKLGVISGSFDVIHEGHIEYILRAIEKFGAENLIVVLNSSDWVESYKARPALLPSHSVKRVLQQFGILFNQIIDHRSHRGKSVVQTLECVQAAYPSDQKVFFKMKDRNSNNCPELDWIKKEPTWSFEHEEAWYENHTSTLIDTFKILLKD